MAGGKITSGVIQQGGARFPGWMNNIGIVNATTTNADDSIKITGSDGTALGPNNYGWITLPGATAGQLAVFSLTADVTIDLTGAHWGYGSHGDLTDYALSLYAINDSGTFKIGVSPIPGLTVILNANDVTTASSASTIEKVLVNSALTGDSPCTEIGYFKANFDDTAGAAEDLWAIQSGNGDINIGISGIGIWHPWFVTIDAVTTAPTKATTTVVDKAIWRKTKEGLDIIYQYNHSDATGAATGTGVYLFPVPSGLTMDTNHINANTDFAQGMLIGHGLVQSTSAAQEMMGVIKAYSSTRMTLAIHNTADSQQLDFISSTLFPLTTTQLSISLHVTGLAINGWY